MELTVVSQWGWIVQVMSPIDFGWSYLPKVRTIYEAMLNKLETEEDASYFFRQACAAISLIKQHNDYDNDPEATFYSVSVSFMPNSESGEFEPVFFHKNTNNGITFVASQFGVPWLDFE